MARVICLIAPLSLGVQILHADSGLKMAWVDLLHPYTYANSPVMLPYVLLCTLLIYVFCIVVDSVRQWLFRPLRRMTWSDRLQKKGAALLDRLNQKMNG